MVEYKAPFVQGEVDHAEHLQGARAKLTVSGIVSPAAQGNRSKKPIALGVGGNELVQGKLYRISSASAFTFYLGKGPGQPNPDSGDISVPANTPVIVNMDIWDYIYVSATGQALELR